MQSLFESTIISQNVEFQLFQPSSYATIHYHPFYGNNGIQKAVQAYEASTTVKK